MLPFKTPLFWMMSLALFALAGCAASPADAAPLVLAQNGKPQAQIVIGAQASAAEKYAAQELQSALFKMSGAQLPITSQMDASTRIVIGTPQSVPAIEKAKLFNTKEEEETRVVRRGDALYLAGKTPGVALRATYTFLQETLGARWFWPGETGEYMPRKSTISVADVNLRQVPALAYRSLSINTPHYDIPTMDWMARNRINVSVMGNSWTDKDVLRRQNAERGWMREINGHTAYLDKDVNDAHPEYVAMVNSKRQIIADPPHICWGNAAARAEFAKKLGRWWDENPDADINNFYGPDHNYFCEDELCIAYAPDASTRWQKFVADVTAQVKLTHPGKKYATLAYQIYRDAPKEQAADLFFNGYCTYNIDYTKPITHPNNKIAAGEMLEWKKRGSNVGIRGYQFIPFNAAMYAPITDLIMQEVKWVSKEKMAGWTSEVQPYGHFFPKDDPTLPEEDGNWATNRMALYAAAQTMWNDKLTSQELMRDWTNHLYGPAAVPMLSYHNAMEKKWQATPDALSYFLHPASSFVGSFITDDLVKNAEADFTAARAALSQEKDARTRNRIAAQIDLESKMFGKWSSLYATYKGRSGRLDGYAARAVSTPQMTADANDAAWQNATALPAFENDKSATPDNPTRAFAQWDDAALYLRFVAEDAEIGKLKADVKGHDNPNIFPQDGIEMFLGDAATAGHYFHLSASAGGATYDAKADAAMNFNSAWNPQWTAKSSRGAKSWIVDVKLPFASFGKNVKLGDVWRLSFFRAGDRFAGSGWPSASVHNAASFGAVHFVEKAPLQKMALFYDSDQKSDTLKTELAALGFMSRSVGESPADWAAALGENPQAVVVRVAGGDNFKLGADVFRDKLQPYLRNGGLVVLSGYGSWPFDQWFGAEAAVKWNGWEIDMVRHTTNMADGDWINQPHDLKPAIKEGTTPSSSFTPQSEGWEILARQKMQDGSEGAFLLRRKIGSGTLVITSSDLGYGGGSEMFGNANPGNAALLLDNFLAAHQAQK